DADAGRRQRGGGRTEKKGQYPDTSSGPSILGGGGAPPHRPSRARKEPPIQRHYDSIEGEIKWLDTCYCAADCKSLMPTTLQPSLTRRGSRPTIDRQSTLKRNVMTTVTKLAPSRKFEAEEWQLRVDLAAAVRP